MMQDWMRNLEVGIPALLEDGIKVLVYAGEEDLICNWLGKPRYTFDRFGIGTEIAFVTKGTFKIVR
jgi:serine carboxypeptidase-like clade 4